jgi:inositol-phosphate phosphatase/L-galactose 1-phosphate phosphatase/histidinol-phosphatase
MPNINTKELIQFANELANASSDIVRSYYGKKIDFEVKEDASPVTSADKEVERALRALIRSTYPDHGIIGEEFEDVNADARYTWVLDPIDGTKSFMIGRPIFGTLISLLSRNPELKGTDAESTPIIGVLDQPILGERWVGALGFATSFNSEPTEVRERAHIAESVLCTTSPQLFDEEDFKKFEKVRKASQYTVYGGDCYSYGLVARGTVDVVIETGLKKHDFLALRPIIEGAKGIMTDWQGNKINEHSDGRVIVCGDARVHKQILELMNS